ncbi:MAG TPA: type I-U CRISPR-associated RAMP protein Csb1/Cas7u [Vicinamibacterales bacterium]|nr:type I-U CRISPR-associated RAMP protein Csb1/Cas7u [Vicinamibacterales bacterium]
MALDLTPLDSASRLLVEAELRVATGGGGRFQPTGFPDLGPALYRGADGANWLLVESPQSIANRLERVCWVDGDAGTDRVGRYNDACKDIPFVLATDADGRPLTASTLEAHRLSSPYIWDTQPFADPDDASKQITLPDYLKRLFSLADNRLVPWKKVAEGLLNVDPGCLLHGLWFNDAAFAGGKVRLTRVLSGYIEARDPSTANFGFQKRDGVSDRTDKEAGQSAAEGFGSVIGPKQHFTSSEIKAYFQIDLERLRSYGLSAPQVCALVAWAIYKIRRVLVASRDGVADLRTECKFEVAQRATSTEGRKDTEQPKVEEAVDCWLIDHESGNRKRWSLPMIDAELKQAFNSLRTSGGPLKVRWVPNVEGKAELPDGAAIKRNSFEAKTKIESPKPKKGKKADAKQAKKFFIIFGEWSSGDKDALRSQNSEEPAKDVIEKAIKDFEKNWEAKAQSRKPEKTDDDQEGDENQA